MKRKIIQLLAVMLVVFTTSAYSNQTTPKLTLTQVVEEFWKPTTTGDMYKCVLFYLENINSY